MWRRSLLILHYSAMTKVGILGKVDSDSSPQLRAGSCPLSAARVRPRPGSHQNRIKPLNKQAAFVNLVTLHKYTIISLLKVLV